MLRRSALGVLALASLAAGCAEGVREPAGARSSAVPGVAGATPSAATSAAAAASASSSATAASAAPVVSARRALEVLFRGSVPGGAPCKPGADPADPDDRAFVRCLVRERFAGHDAEQQLALALFDASGDVVGTEREQDMEGGFRGTIHLVPELPVGPHAKHLRWIVGAQEDIARFVSGLEEASGGKLRYRHTALAWKFMRSVGRTTPSAYADDWEVGYNVSGSLHAGQQAVTETIFHELFHVNDQAHGNWSRVKLGRLVDGIAAKCGTKTACLKPYAPGKTMVRGGTYYAFQPDNGDMAHEYAAELATRYFLEQSAVLRGEKVATPFKCGPPENAEAWRALADEFFAGADRVPACP